MPGRYEDTRACGRAILTEHLGVDELNVQGLVTVAEAVLGPARAARCVELARSIRLTQRYHGLAALAALVVGTRQLGETWWSRAHEPVVPLLAVSEDPVSPDDRVWAGSAEPPGSWPPVLVELGYWIADDAAVAVWGPLVDEVDLNDPRPSDRIRRLPHGVTIGARVIAHFDAGGVVDAIVEERAGGALGTRLDIESSRYSLPAEVDWAWAVAFPPPGPFPLPGDEPDPYSIRIDDRAAAELRREAQQFGWRGLGPRWRTRGDLCAVLSRLDWPWLTDTAETLEWRRRMERLIDDEHTAE